MDLQDTTPPKYFKALAAAGVIEPAPPEWAGVRKVESADDRPSYLESSLFAQQLFWGKHNKRLGGFSPSSQEMGNRPRMGCILGLSHANRVTFLPGGDGCLGACLLLLLEFFHWVRCFHKGKISGETSHLLIYGVSQWSAYHCMTTLPTLHCLSDDIFWICWQNVHT